MKLPEAIDIVLQLAKQGMIDIKEAEAMDLIDQLEDQDEAIGIVEDLFSLETGLAERISNVRNECSCLDSKTDAGIIDYALVWLVANADTVEEFEVEELEGED